MPQRSYSGRFKPSNPGKYKGDPTNIIYRSLWERKLMVWCDNNANIQEWGSEKQSFLTSVLLIIGFIVIFPTSTSEQEPGTEGLRSSLSRLNRSRRQFHRKRKAGLPNDT